MPGDSVGFVPSGGHWRMKTRNFLPGFVLEIEPRNWPDALTASLEIETADLDYLDYVPDQVSADLARAGIALLTEARRTHERADVLALEAIWTGLLARFAGRLRGTSKRHSAGTNATIPRARLSRVLDHVEAHLDERLTVTGMAELAGMLLTSFGEAFRRATDVPPARYVTLRRVTRAKWMLTHGDAPLARIAYDCGFAGQAHFTRVFKTVVGTTLGAYRHLMTGRTRRVS